MKLLTRPLSQQKLSIPLLVALVAQGCQATRKRLLKYSTISILDLLCVIPGRRISLPFVDLGRYGNRLAGW